MSFIEEIPKLRILVIGDMMLDIYEKYSTENSKPIFSEKEGKRAYQKPTITQSLGGAGNVAANLSSLGVITSLTSIIGDDSILGIDPYAKMIEILVAQKGIYFKPLKDANRVTTTKRRIYIDDEYIMRIDNEDTFNYGMKYFYMSDFSLDAVILSDYDKGFFNKDISEYIINECNKRNIPVIVDPKPQNIQYFYGATVIAPNQVEASILDINDLKGYFKNIVITKGERGIYAFDCIKNQAYQVEPNIVKVKDAVGCGDTVIAGLAISLALKRSLLESIKFANDMASLVIQKEGTSTISLDELKEFY